MATQLVLLDSPTPPWKLDHRTREIGRRGVASARESLRRATAPAPVSAQRAAA